MPITAFTIRCHTRVLRLTGTVEGWYANEDARKRLVMQLALAGFIIESHIQPDHDWVVTPDGGYCRQCGLALGETGECN